MNIIKPEELTPGVYVGRTMIGPGAYQKVVIMIRGNAPFYTVKAIANRNNGFEDMPNAGSFVGSGVLEVNERLCDL